MAMSDASVGPARDFGDYGRLLRRRWAWILAGLVIGLWAAIGYLYTATPTYVATAKVQVLPTGFDTTSANERTTGPVNLDTEAQLVASATVASRAAEILNDGGSPVQLAHRVAVAVPPNTTVLAISFSAPTADEAQQGAQAFAQAYLDYRQATAQAQIDAQTQQLNSQMSSTNQSLLQVIRAINSRVNPPTASELGFLQARQNSLTTQLASLQTQLAAVGTNPDPGTIFNDALLPSKPTTPNPTLVLPSGLMLGLLGGLGLAAVRERTDRRIRAGADVERLFDVPVLAQLGPRRAFFGNVAVGGLIDHELRALFRAVEAAAPGRAPEVVLVASPTPSLATGKVAYALSVVASRTGVRTALLARNPGAEKTPTTWGRRDDLDIVGYDGVGAVSAGEIRPADLAAALERLRRDHSFIVMDMPTGDPVLDLPVMTRYADVVVLTIELRRTTNRTLRNTLSMLTRSGTAQVFAVTVPYQRARFRRQPRQTPRRVAVATHDTGGTSPRAAAAATGGSREAASPPRPPAHADPDMAHGATAAVPGHVAQSRSGE